MKWPAAFYGAIYMPRGSHMLALGTTNAITYKNTRQRPLLDVRCQLKQCTLKVLYGIITIKMYGRA